MKSLCTPMKAEDLTTLKIRYDWKKDQFWMEAMKQWEQDLDFSKYNKEFYVESILTEDVVYLNTKQVRALYKKYDLEDYLDEILDLIRQGRHFGIECYYHHRRIESGKRHEFQERGRQPGFRRLQDDGADGGTGSFKSGNHGIPRLCHR